jgi:hypothetical protein
MHTARQLHAQFFQAQIRGKEATLDDVLPNWSANDRFGIVIDQPLGGLGAAMLIQAATSQFFDAVPGRRDVAPQYPEIYAFHLDRWHGELSQFDFWPPRKEVLLDASHDLVAAINDRAITRLAVPEKVRKARVSPLFWADIMSLRERVVQCFTYSPTGRVQAADFTLSALTDGLERNADRATDLELRLKSNATLTDEQRLALTPGPVTDQEIKTGREHLQRHRGDVSQENIERTRNYREALQSAGLSTESYKMATLTEALHLLGVDEHSGIR